MYYRYSETSLSSSGSTPPGRVPSSSYSHAYTGVNPEGFQAASENPLLHRAGPVFPLPASSIIWKVFGISRVRNEEALFIGNLFHNLLEACSWRIRKAEEFLKRKLAEYLQEENIELNAREEFFRGKYLEVLLRFRRFLKLRRRRVL